MCHADAQPGHPPGPIGLIHNLRDDHLRRARPCGRRRRARTAVMNDGGNPAEQRLLVDLANKEAVVPVVDQAMSAQPRARTARRPCARIAWIAALATSFAACTAMLPKPT